MRLLARLGTLLILLNEKGSSDSSESPGHRSKSPGHRSESCSSIEGFDPFEYARLTPLTRPCIDQSAVKANVAWRKISEGGAEGGECPWSCRKVMSGNSFGYGSFLNSLIGGARRALAEGAMPVDLPLPESLLEARRPQQTEGNTTLMSGAFELFQSDACKSGLLGCFLQPPMVQNRSICPRLSSCDTVRRSKVRRKHDTSILHVSSVFWNVAATTARVLQPSPEFSARLDAERLVLGFGRDAQRLLRPTLAMHIRRGDSCADGKRTGRVCSSGADYAAAASELASKYGFKSLLVATDSDGALAEVSGTTTKEHNQGCARHGDFVTRILIGVRGCLPVSSGGG